MQYIYQARFEPDPDGGFLVTFPDVPEAITQGDDAADAVASAADALAVALRGYAKDGRNVPAPTAPAGAGLHAIAVPLDDALKLSLIEAFRHSGLTRVEMAARLGKTEKEARRILDPDYPTKLPTLNAALALFGKRTALVVETADLADRLTA